MAKKTETNIEVATYPSRVRKDEKGFYVLMGIKADNQMLSHVRFNVDEEFEPHVRSLYREEGLGWQMKQKLT